MKGNYKNSKKRNTLFFTSGSLLARTCYGTKLFLLLSRFLRPTGLYTPFSRRSRLFKPFFQYIHSSFPGHNLYTIHFQCPLTLWYHYFVTISSFTSFNYPEEAHLCCWNTAFLIFILTHDLLPYSNVATANIFFL